MKKAFTIIEIVVAITVLGIGVIGVASFFAVSAQVARHAGNTSVASNLAQGAIDETMSQPYANITVGTVPKSRISNDTESPFYNYQKETNISLIDSNLNASNSDVGLKKIIITIYYQENNAEKNVQMATIKTRR